MAMANMKIEDEGLEEYKPNPYGCGLTIYLTEDQVEALGLKDNPPATGSTVGIQAIAQVVTKSEDADIDGDGDGVDVRLTLQITDMQVTPQGYAVQATALYGA